MKQQKRTLFFLAGDTPTDEERSEAEGIEGLVMYRNASVVRDDEAIEQADAYAGAVPQRYQDAMAVQEKVKGSQPKEGEEGETEPPPEPPVLNENEKKLANDLRRGEKKVPVNSPFALRSKTFKDREEVKAQQEAGQWKTDERAPTQPDETGRTPGTQPATLTDKPAV